MNENGNSVSKIVSESDVEQKIIINLLTNDMPEGFGYLDSDFATKPNINGLSIGKGTSQKIYYPDYIVLIDGLPVTVIEAKKKGEDLAGAIAEARLYSIELNSRYPHDINPCSKLIACDGDKLLASHWDDASIPVELDVADLNISNSDFNQLMQWFSKNALKKHAADIRSKIKGQANYIKPVHMLGGQTVVNQTVGENSFGSNVSIEYRYLFNPDSQEERDAISLNAYVRSKRRESHVSPIDRIIRATIPKHVMDARAIDDSRKPSEILGQFEDIKSLANQVCLLIGGVGSGKSTFTDYLKNVALPSEVRRSTGWLSLNLNEAPLERDRIYRWVVEGLISRLEKSHKDIDFSNIESLKKIFSEDIRTFEKGVGSLLGDDLNEYNKELYKTLTSLISNRDLTLQRVIEYLLTSRNKLSVIVLDNCDKRESSDQLLMFEVATWLKDSFKVMIFLPIRDTTYDQFSDIPPLDTAIKDLVFRIEPPLLEKVIQERLNYALREINEQKDKFVYHLPNGMKVECSRQEVSAYLKAIVQSLFQNTMFRRIIKGIAGRNIRKGLEIILDFCKSGHIAEDEIFKLRQSQGDYQLSNHVISKILFKGNRRFYDDSESNIKNLFHSDQDDNLPDPFLRLTMLRWLKLKYKEKGPSRVQGYHKVSMLIQYLITNGHEEAACDRELHELVRAECILAEGDKGDIAREDLIAISPSGVIHLELLKNISYVSAVSEDTFYRDNQTAKAISDHLTGNSGYPVDSKQSDLIKGTTLVQYLVAYQESHFFELDDIITTNSLGQESSLNHISDFYQMKVENDPRLSETHNLIIKYPKGTVLQTQIVSIQTYGFFVDIGLDASGLVHLSRIPGKSSTLYEFEEGDWVDIEIIDYQTKHRKFDCKLLDSVTPS